MIYKLLIEWQYKYKYACMAAQVLNVSRVTMNIDIKYAYQILTGDKRFEGRAYRGKFRDEFKENKNQVCEISGITVVDGKEETIVKFDRVIGRILTFRNFEEALTTLGVDIVLPGVGSIAEGVAIYNAFMQRIGVNLGALAEENQKLGLGFNAVCMIELLVA